MSLEQVKYTSIFSEGVAIMKYPFKRDFYISLKNTMQTSFATALLGPRKCGKTIALLQLHDELTNSKYYDAKKMSHDDQDALLAQILKSIDSNDDVIYLIDEVTYIDCADVFIETIAVESKQYQCPNTHIIFTGSQSIALRCWIDRSFGGCAGYVRVDFMNYAEWLRFMSETSHVDYENPTEENYIDFLSSIDKFYAFPSLGDYLHACLEETAISNQHSMNLIFNNDIDGLTEQFLLDMLFSTLVTLHNQVAYDKFTSSEMLYKTINKSYKNSDYDMSSVKCRIDDIVQKYYTTFKSADINDIINALMFLCSCGLIRVFEVGDSPSYKDYNAELCAYASEERKQKVFNKQTLFKTLNITIVHPMFYVALLKEALSISDIKKIPGMILGSIVECHCRGLLPIRSAYEFRTTIADDKGYLVEKEIDYVNPLSRLAIECTISDVHGECFDLLDFDKVPYSFIKLSRSVDTSWKSEKGRTVRCIPYYKFLYHLSLGEDPVDI